MTAIAIEPPCSVVCMFSNGECEYASAKSVQPSDQMSTFSSRVTPVFTSNSSGARYAIVLCSAAMSCWSRACERFSTFTRAFIVLPKSMRIGWPSSEIITFLQ